MARRAHALRSQWKTIASTRYARYVVPGIALPALLAAGALGTAATSVAATPGSVAASFGSDGTATTDVTAVLGPDLAISDAVAEPNGDVVVGDALGLVRFLPTGQLDTSFGSGGYTTAPNVLSIGGEPATIAVQPDGKILWAGAGAATAGGSDWEIARFNANGTLDTSFGTGGIVTTEFFATPVSGDQEVPRAVLPQPNGQILVSGSAEQIVSYKGGGLGGNAVVRYNANGTLDTSFGTGGKVLTGDFGAGVAVISTGLAFAYGELGLDASGDIFVAPGSNITGTEAEFSSSGQPDPAVTSAPVTASSGPALLPSGQYQQANTVAIAKHVDGLQVDLFSAGGTQLSASSPLKLAGLAAGDLPGGQTLVAGITGGNSLVDGAGPELAALNADGTADTAFGSDGVATSPLPASEAVISVIAAITEPSGQVLIVSETTDNINSDEQISLTLFNG